MRFPTLLLQIGISVLLQNLSFLRRASAGFIPSLHGCVIFYHSTSFYAKEIFIIQLSFSFVSSKVINHCAIILRSDCIILINQEQQESNSQLRVRSPVFYPIKLYSFFSGTDRIRTYIFGFSVRRIDQLCYCSIFGCLRDSNPVLLIHSEVFYHIN